MLNNNYKIDEIEKENPYIVTVEDYYKSSLNDYDSFDKYSWNKGKGYSCPNFPIFDEKTEGLEDGLYLFAAESNMGKSAFMSNLLWDYCTNPDNNLFGVYFALDDTKQEMIPRLISMLELIPISIASKPSRYKEKIDLCEEGSSIYQEMLDKREHGLKTLKELNTRFKLEDSEKLDCGEKILDYCKKLKEYLKGYDPKTNLIIGIDSLFDLNFPSQKFKTDKEKNEYIAQEIKRWAKTEIKAPIFGTIHLRKIDKRRAENDDKAVAANIIGDVKGKTALIFDDEVSTAGTMVEAAKILKDHGAKEIYAACTHGILCGPAIERIQNSPIKELVTTNTVPLTKEKQIDKIKVLSIAPLFAEAIKRVNEAQPLGDLFDFDK